MSADNWTICPRCEEKRLETYKRALEESSIRLKKKIEDLAKETNLPVPLNPEEYKIRLTEIIKAEETVQPEAEDTLREDFDIGIYEGHFSIEYEAKCTKCGFEFSFYPDKVKV